MRPARAASTGVSAASLAVRELDEAGEGPFAPARSVADAVLYEGYVLYPYRASSRKNQVRFQWGVLTPRDFAEADGSERWWSRTECLVAPSTQTPGAAREPVLRARVRFLQTQRRRVEAARLRFNPVEHLDVDGTRHVPWEEAVDRVVDLPPLPLVPGAGSNGREEEELRTFRFGLGASTQSEVLYGRDGTMVGRFVRERFAIDGTIRVGVHRIERSPLVKVSVTVENTTGQSADATMGPEAATRHDATAHSLVAVHTMLALDRGRFVSLLDPPADARDAAASCVNDGTYPVLVGNETLVLSSPIILYDHPEIAPQSPGDLYDSLEVDEILALRVMTLTEDEKSEARGTDARAAAIIDRCERLSPTAMGRLHGEMRPVVPTYTNLSDPPSPPIPTDPVDSALDAAQAAPWWDPGADASVDPWTDRVQVDGVELAKGSAVLLHPSGRSDAQDMFLDGRRATVAGVFADVDGGFHLAVTLDEDPAAAELVWQGRFLYFHPSEIEPLPDAEQAEQAR